MRKILVTGGAGFIGSHTVVKLMEQPYEVVIYDNFSNSCSAVIDRIQTITGSRPIVVEGDVLDDRALDQVFSTHQFDDVIHFAGLKAVGESVEQPLKYYQNNVAGSLGLFRAMAAHACTRIVFSSSATVYGQPESVPIKEDSPLSASNPYGQSKLMVEEVLRDLARADARWQVSLLRYFNPVAAHPSGLLGEDPNGVPNNLMPFIAQVGVGKLQQLEVFGGDYDTPDGTGKRDYIHVVDLAEAHLKALENLGVGKNCEAYNIGTGQGYSVLEMITAFEKASGRDIPYRIVQRRPGDIAECYADPNLSQKQLGWQAEFGLDQMMRDQWNWQSNNPNGYAGQEDSVPVNQNK